MAIPSILLILVSSLLLSHPQARRTLEPEPEPPAICSSSCGGIGNISYPFRLTTDPPGCGDPDFELSCGPTNRTTLRYLSHSYYVNHISYHNSTIRVVDPNLADGACTFPSTPLSYYDPRFTVPIDTFLLSFLNCSSNVSHPKYIRVPCLSTNAHSSVYLAYDGFTFPDLDPSCSLISTLPVLPQGPRNMSYQATVELFRSGFDLSWSVFCRDCVHSGGSCVVASFDDPYVYVCADDDYLVSVLISYVASLLGSFLFVAILVVRQVLVPLVLVAFLIHKYVTTRKKVDNVGQFVRNEESAMPKRYSYVDIVAITNHFRDKMGQGGFGSVYKGQLPDPGGCFVAVKMLNSSCKFRGDEFINEVSTIGRVRHRNLVGLMGFCSEGSHRALVYEYMPNGSLDKHIFSEKGKAQLFCWEKLLEIALGAARGINCLHKGCDVCILHFNIKPHNVLLDHDFVPKIADFGLAKFNPKERDIVSVSTTRGAIGYIAPELMSKTFGTVSTKTDVYSFGMVLMEMAGGRRNVDVREESSSRVHFPLWAHERLSGGEGLGLENVSDSESKIAQKMCVVGLWCIQTKAADRPSMSRVVEMLQGIFEDLQMPPKPEFSTPEYVSMRDSKRESSSECLISESVERSFYIDNSIV